MKNLQQATERICELKGCLVALDAFVPAVIEALSPPTRERLTEAFEAHAEAARTVLLHADISDVVLSSFEHDVARNRALLQAGRGTPDPAPAGSTVDALLLATTPVATFRGSQALTRASGFFYRTGTRLFLVTNRHVLVDPASGHFPDRVEIGVHTELHDLTRHVVVSMPLHHGDVRRWHEARDSGGTVDVAALEVLPGALPPDAQLRAFDHSHLDPRGEDIAVGDALTIAGFPLGFHDAVHHLGVARSASIASAYGVRFQRLGCFLTDARTHRGSSGSPVVRRRAREAAPAGSLSWQLLGVHSTRMDMGPRDPAQDESLGLNCAWYADVLVALTAEAA
jgi:hypothetical protein